MSISEAIKFFKRLSQETENKREIKIYENFIGILSILESRDLNKEQIFLVEEKLDILNFKSYPENKKRYFSKKLTTFKQFLKAEFSLISEGYYTAIGMSLGMCFGIAIGAAFNTAGVSIGLVIGMLIGIVIGRLKDMEAEKNNRVLKNSISRI